MERRLRSCLVLALVLLVVPKQSSKDFCSGLPLDCRTILPGPVQRRAARSLQDAIDSLPDGCMLELPPGQYQNTKPIVIKRNVSLVGSSGARTQLSGSFIFEIGAEYAVLRNVDVVNSRRFVAVHLRCAGRPRVEGQAGKLQCWSHLFVA